MVTSSGHHNGHVQTGYLHHSCYQSRFLGDSMPPVIVVIVRAVRANGSMEGYQAAAYIDNADARLQVIVAALDENDNWKMCADGIMLSKHKVMVRLNTITRKHDRSRQPRSFCTIKIP